MLWRQLFIGTSLVILITLLITGIWHLTRLPAFTITNVQVIGGTTIPGAQIETAANAELTGTYYRLIPKRFSYLYPHDRIIAAIEAEERIKHVAIERAKRQTLIVAFEEYEPYALWCESVDSEQCLFIDRHGFAFTAAPTLSGGAFLRFVTMGTEPDIGTAAVAAGVVRGAQAFVETTYERLGLNITSVTIDRNDVLYQVAGGGEVRTSTNMSYTDTLANLETILASNEFAHLGPGQFAYIDLRFGDKVFVHEGIEEVATSTETIEIEE